MILRSAGLLIDLPTGWDAEIWGNPSAGLPAVAHLSNGPLPSSRSDFGGHALEAMPPDGVFVAFLESAPGEAGTGVFVRSKRPRVTPAQFGANRRNKEIEGHVATQRFFSENGRAFCLYAVVSSDARVQSGAALVNQAIRAVTIEPLGTVLD